MASIPPAEVDLDAATVARLVRQQAPHLGDRQVEPFAHGWDNQTFALGSDLLVRLPRRQAAAGLIAHEIAVLPRLADRLPVPVPVPVFAGQPSRSFPWPWTIVPQLPGQAACQVAAVDRKPAASELARFLVALHTPADADAPTNPFRGVRLAERAAALAGRIEAVAGAAALDAWQQRAAAAPWPGPPVWLHGDLHPMNILLHADGSLAAVIDFGDVCSGDPATDLAAAWLMFDADARDELRTACTQSGAYDHQVWARAWAWALGLAAAFAQASDDMPDLARIAEHGLVQTLNDPEFGPAG